MSMGIYIKDMEMPKSCYACCFFGQADVWASECDGYTKSFCKRTGSTTFDVVDGFLPGCPLVAVPPHGRLIDADAMIHDIEKAISPTEYIKNRNSNMVYFLRHQETIIPADPAEDGEK